jgi:hypothetical protein
MRQQQQQPPTQSNQAPSYPNTPHNPNGMLVNLNSALVNGNELTEPVW